MTLSSRSRLERRLVPEHRPEDVDAASSKRDHGLVMSFAFLSFPVVISTQDDRFFTPENAQPGQHRRTAE